MEAYKGGDYPRALAACAQAPADTGAQAMAHSTRASILAKLERIPEALDEIEAAIGLGARSVQLYRLAAMLCLRSRDGRAALDWIDRGLQVGPGSDGLLELRERVVRSMHLVAGLCDHFELAVAQRPQSLEDREKLIRAHLRLGFYDTVDTHLDAAIQLSPASVSLLLDKAWVSIERRAFADAIRILEGALTLQLSLPERQRAVALFVKVGALERAWQTSEANLAISGSGASVVVQHAFLALWRGDAAAAAALSEGIAGDVPGGTRLRAAIALVRGAHEEAFDLTTEALAQDPSDAEAHALRGAALFRLGNFADAEVCARTATHGQHEWSPGVHLLEVAAHVRQQSKVTLFQVTELLELFAPLWPGVELSSTDKDLCLSDPQSVLDALSEGLRQLSGNFSNAFTYVDSTGEWSTFPARRPARMACLRVFDWIQVKPFPWVLERMRGLAADYPKSPYVHTHAAELALWSGDYRTCEEECTKALAISKSDGTRWAWVGLGAALMLQERFDEALAVFHESNQRLPPGSPLLAYRGETLRRRGEWQAARDDLREALRLSPNRISAWVNLALVAAQCGEEEEAQRIHLRLRKRMPDFWWDVEYDLCGRAIDSAPTPAVVAKMLEHALVVMHGNRSANRVTYFLKDGEARVVPALAC